MDPLKAIRFGMLALQGAGGTPKFVYLGESSKDELEELLGVPDDADITDIFGLTIVLSELPHGVYAVTEERL